MRMIIASVIAAILVGCGQNSSSSSTGQPVRYIREGGIICVDAKSTYVAANILKNSSNSIDILTHMIVAGKIACTGARDDLPIIVENEMASEGIVFFKRPGIGSGWTFTEFVRRGTLVNGELKKY